MSEKAETNEETPILFLGEWHASYRYEDTLNATLDILDWFKPERIAIETRHNRLDPYMIAELKKIKAGDEEALSAYIEHMENVKSNPMRVGAFYAAKHGLPLHFLDWQPTHPKNLSDILTTTLPKPSYQEMEDWFVESIDKLIGEDQSLFAMDRAIENEAQDIAERVFKNKGLEPDEEKAAMVWAMLAHSAQGMAVRNEYTSLALEQWAEGRTAYLGGCDHFTDDLGPVLGTPEYWTPLSHLVNPFSKSYTHMSEVAQHGVKDAIPTSVTASRKRQLDWSKLDYMVDSK